MNCIVIYDIVEDKIRNKIADVCLDFGLERIQYSAFFGELTHNQKETLLKKSKKTYRDERYESMHTGNCKFCKR